MISQFGYLGIGVSDIKAWEEFGQEVLGLQLQEKLEDGTLYLRQDEYHHRFIVEYGWGGREVDDTEWVAQQYHTGDTWGHERPGTYSPEEVAKLDTTGARR